MKSQRRKARVLAMQVLFQSDVRGDQPSEEVEAYLAEQADDPIIRDYARGLIRDVAARREHYDRLLSSVSRRWDVRRMPPVDRNVMRIALCEMLDRDDPPASVAISEAMEIARRFGAAESASFVNGILDAIWKRRSPGSRRDGRGPGEES